MNRYMTHKYKWRQTAHGVAGILMVVLTLLGFTIVFDMAGWEIMFDEPHSKVANPTVWVGILTALGGLIAVTMRGKSGTPEYEWNSAKWQTMVKAHRVFGYVVLLFANVVTMTLGINCKWYPDMIGMVFGVAVLNLLVLGTFLFVMEMNHMHILEQEDAWTMPAKPMSATEFDRAVLTGRKYVLLDNVVLDLEPFMKHHPGGEFVLRQNIGRNITKFFLGSYSLEGNLVPNGPDRRVTHSNYARKIANDLIVGYFESQKYPTSTV